LHNNDATLYKVSRGFIRSAKSSFDYLNVIDSGKIDANKVAEIAAFR
jgi:hypothetical protein